MRGFLHGTHIYEKVRATADECVRKECEMCTMIDMHFACVVCGMLDYG